MSHNLYAEISDDHKELYYNSDEIDPDEIDGYPYSTPPAIGVKFIRSSSWLPEYIRDGVWDEYTPNQARMYAKAIASELSKLENMPKDARQNEMERLINVIGWLNYWAGSEVKVRGAP